MNPRNINHKNTMATHNLQTQSTSTSLSLSLPLLQSSLTSLSAALATLDACTADLPRLSHVLTSTRHFELLPSSTLAAAQTKLVDEIQPEVLRLLQVVEGVVERRERRGEWLRARWGLYEGRLGRDEVGGRSGSKAAKGSAQTASTGAADDLKTQRLRQKKERLSYAVERLQLQAQQKERQLRMSMAQQGVAIGGKSDEGGRGVEAEEEEDDDDFRV